MKVSEAKAMVVELMLADMRVAPTAVLLDPRSPDIRDPGKFILGGQPARAVHHFDGWYVPINLDWFSGSLDWPAIQGFPFYWYVFAIPRRNRYRADHYFICDYLQMRSWVLDFAAPLGRDHKEHQPWRADLRVFTDDGTEATGYFRWGDESTDLLAQTNRVIELDNVDTVSELTVAGLRVGVFGPGGESAAHRRLKLYVATHPVEFGMSAEARAHIEYSFRTGDRVDVMFENHLPDRTVVEIEVDGEDNVCVGIQQAIKYRSLAEVDGGYRLLSDNVRSLVVAYETNYPLAVALAGRYEISLMAVDRKLVLDPAV